MLIPLTVTDNAILSCSRHTQLPHAQPQRQTARAQAGSALIPDDFQATPRGHLSQNPSEFSCCELMMDRDEPSIFSWAAWVVGGGDGQLAAEVWRPVSNQAVPGVQCNLDAREQDWILNHLFSQPPVYPTLWQLPTMPWSHMLP